MLARYALADANQQYTHQLHKRACAPSPCNRASLLSMLLSSDPPARAMQQFTPAQLPCIVVMQAQGTKQDA